MSQTITISVISLHSGRWLSEGELASMVCGKGTCSRPRHSSLGSRLLPPYTPVALESHQTCGNFSFCISIQYISKDQVPENGQSSRHCTVLTIHFAHFLLSLPTFSEHITKPLNISFLLTSVSRHLGQKFPSENTIRPWLTNFILTFNTRIDRLLFISLMRYLEQKI